jgi:hypothetical protein
MPLALAELVELRQQRGGAQRLAVDADRVAVLELDGDLGRNVGGVHRADGALPDHLVRRVPGLLENLTLGAAVQHVGVDAEGRLAALVLGDGDLVRLGEFDELGAARQVPFAPGGDDLHIRLQRVVAELEAHLVVALAGGAMGHGIGADLLGDLDLALGDERPRDGGAQQVLALVQRVGAEHREDEVLHEGLAQVVDEDVLRLDAEQQRLVAGRAELLALAEIGGEGHDLASVGGLEPLQDHGGVEPTGIGQHDLLDVFDPHVLSLSGNFS